MSSSSNILYFDYAATAPCAPEVVQEIVSSLSDNGLFANASSAHGLAYSAENSIQHARTLVSGLVNSEPSDIIFTSGATESNNLALIGLSNFLKQNGKTHIVSSSVEHKAVLDTLKHLIENGFSVTLIDPDINGLIKIADIENAITPQTGLVSIMHVNNETGVIQDVSSIGKITKRINVLFHVDAAQSTGKISINVKDMNIDMLSMSTHKFYGPKGSGALYINNKLQSNLSPILHGGGQEKGLRPGTCANHQIIGLGKAAELAKENIEKDLKHAKQIRELILNKLGDVVRSVNGEGIPNILNVSIDNVDATTLLTSLQNKVALATGSACNSGTVSPSHVLTAMGLSNEQIDNAIRISFGRYTTIDEAEKACQIIKSEIERIKNYF